MSVCLALVLYGQCVDGITQSVKICILPSVSLVHRIFFVIFVSLTCLFV